MNLPVWVRLYRVFFGALALAAIVVDFRHNQEVKPDFDPANFLSLFTNQSNFIAGIVLLAGAFLPASRAHSHGWDIVRGAAVMYMTTTGVVYALLLGGLFNPFADDQTWMNSVLHQVMPVVLILDLLIQPLATRISMKDALIWTIYPLLFLAYSLVRGPIVDWYPYSFLSPDEVGGYGGVAMYTVAICIGFLLMAAFIAWISRTLRGGRAYSA